MCEPLIDRLEVFASFHTSRVRYRNVEPFSDYDDLMSMVKEVEALKDRVEKAQELTENDWTFLLSILHSPDLRQRHEVYPLIAKIKTMKKALGGSSTCVKGEDKE